MQTRRDFLKTTALAGASLALFRGKTLGFSQSPTNLRKFIQPLPRFGPEGIPLATPNTTKFPGSDYYEIEVGQFQQQLHPNLPATTLRGYADTAFGFSSSGGPNHRYLGGAIVAKKDRPVWLKVKNNLPDSPDPLAVDNSLMGVMNGQNDNRICTHLHGGFVPWTSDGGPNAWFDPHGNVGPSFIPSINGTGTVGESLLYYPNQQTGRLMWYHDHAMGMTRLNAYAGIASAYLLMDDYELSLVDQGIIPSNQIPLVIQDKSFVSSEAIRSGYKWGKVGDLWYPYLYEPDRWELGSESDPPCSGPASSPAGTVLRSGIF